MLHPTVYASIRLKVFSMVNHAQYCGDMKETFTDGIFRRVFFFARELQVSYTLYMYTDTIYESHSDSYPDNLENCQVF